MAKTTFYLLILGLFIFVASPLLLPVGMGAILAVLCYPLVTQLETRKFSIATAAALITAAISLVFLFPSALLIFLAAKTGLQQLYRIREAPQGDASGGLLQSLLGPDAFNGILSRLAEFFPNMTVDIRSSLEELTRSVALKLADSLGTFLTSLPGLTMALVIVIISIYFFLADGRRFVDTLRKYSMFNPAHTEMLIASFSGLCRSVILASVVSGVIQAVIITISCLVTGTPNAFFIGFLVFLCSFIPLVGSAPVTFGLAIQQFFLGFKTIGIVLLIAAVVVSVLDNLIRPIVLKGAGNLHPLLGFVAAFGGIQAIGFAGVFVGPIIAGIFITTLQILQEAHGEERASRQSS